MKRNFYSQRAFLGGHRRSRKADKGRRNHSPMPPPIFQQLEDRTLLSDLTLTSGVLTYTAAAGRIVNNGLLVSYSGGNYTFTDTETITCGIAGWSTGSTTVTGPATGVNSILIDLTKPQDPAHVNDAVTLNSLNHPTTIDGSAGNDTFTINSTGQLIEVEGNNPLASGSGDTLAFGGTINVADTYAITPGADSQSGAATVNINGAGASVVSYTGIEFITINGGGGTGSDTLTVNGTGADNDINFAGTGAVAATAQVDGNPLITVSSFGSTGGAGTFTLNGLAGDDDISVAPGSLGTAEGITVAGGDPSAGSDADRLAVAGTSSANTIGFNPSATLGSGTVTISGVATTTFNHIEQLVIDGQGGNDTLTTTGPAAGLTYTVTPGTMVDSGSIQVGSLVPMSYQNLGSTGGVTVNAVAGGGTDTLVMQGTEYSDTFTVTTTTAKLNSQLTTTYSNMDQTTLEGGEPSPGSSDVATITGSGADVTANLGGTSPTITGAGLGTVNLNGIETVNLTASGELTVSGTTGNDTAVASPTSSTAVTVQVNAVSPVLNASGMDTLTMDLGAGSDQLTVNATQAAQTITITPTTVTVAGLKAVTYSNTEDLVVNGLAGNDTFSVTTTSASTTVHVNGADPLAGSDTLSFSGTSGVADTYAITPGADNQSGEATVNINGAGAEVVSYTGIEAIAINGGGGTGSDTLTVNGTGADNDINFAGTGAVAATAQVDGNPLITVSSFGSTGGAGTFTLNGLAGDDDISVAPGSLGTAEGITVAGGDPSAGSDADRLAVAGTSSANTIGYNPSATLGSGTVTISGVATTTFNHIEQLVIDGQGGGDTLTTTGPAAGLVYTVAPGATADSGGVQVGTLIPMSFQNLGTGGGLTVTRTGDGNTLEVEGTANDDLFTVTTTSVQVDNQITTTHNFAGGSNEVMLLGMGSADDADEAAITGSGAAVTANLGGTGPTITGGGLGTVELSGIGVVNLNAGAGNLTVSGTGGNDTAVVSPTGAAAATVQVNDVSPVLNASNIGTTFLVDLTTGSDQLTVNGTESAETITITPTVVTVDSFKAVTYANTEDLVVNGLAGNDTFSVTTTSASTTVHVNGADPLAGSDTLSFSGTSGVADTYAITPGADSQSGEATVNINGAGAEVVSYTGIEAIAINGGGGTGSDTLTVNGTTGNNAFDFDGTGAVAATVVVDSGPLITVSAFGSTGGAGTFTLNGLEGSDAFSISPSGLGSALGITVNGADPTAGSAADTLVVDGTATANAIGFNPSATVGSGTVTITGLPTTTFSGVEQLVIDGQGGGDTLTVTGPVAGLTYTVTSGAAVDSGAVLVDGLVPMSYQNLGSGGVTVNAVAGGGTDTLVMQGTTFDDTFTINDATVQLNNQVAVTYSNMDQLTLAGGDPSASDVAAITAGSAAVTVNLGDTSPTITGGDLPTINLNGIEVVNLDANSQNLTVNGTSGDDSAEVSPTASDAATVQVNDVSPVLNASDIGTTFLVDLGTGSDQLTVNGTEGVETITVTSTTVTVGSLKAVTYANTENLAIAALAGADTIDVTPSATTTISVDGGDPIGSQPGDNLIVHNGGSATTVWRGPEDDEGGVDVTGSQTVSFDEIETLTIDGGGSATIMGTTEDDQITIVADSTDPGTDGIQDFVAQVSDWMDVLFLNTPAVTVDALAGSDEIVVIAPAPNGAVWNVDVTVDGGPPSASGAGDTLVVETPYDAQTATYTPSGLGAGVLNISSLSSTIHITDIEQFVYDGEAENDTLTVNWTGTNTYQSAGPATDAGSFSVDSLLPLNFEALGSTAVLNVHSTAIGDTLVMEGTAYDDTFTVTTATVQLNSQLVINDNLDTADTLALLGGDPSASDVAFITAGDAVTVANLGSISPSITGGELPTINLNGIEIVNLDANDEGLTVNGTTDNDSAVVSPTDTAAATVQINGFSPVLYANNLDSLAVDLGLGSDQLTVNGTQSGEKITVTPTSVAVGILQSVDYSNTEDLVVNGLAGDDTFSVTASGTSPTIHVNGGDPLAPFSDTLALGGTADAADIYAIAPGADNQSGVAMVNINGAGSSTVSFTGIEFITIDGGGGTGRDQLTVNGTGGDDTFDFVGLGAVAATVQVNDNPLITVNAFGSDGGASTFTLNGQAGSDTFSVTPGSLGSNLGVMVNGGDPTAGSDTLVVDGTSSPDAIGFDPSATVGSGDVTITGLPTTNFNGIEQLVIDGQGGGDTLTISGPVAGLTYTVTAGAAVDSGAVLVGGLVPMSFQNLGSGGLTVDAVSGGGTDTLVMEGTAFDDTFTVGIITAQLNSQLAVTYSNIDQLTLEGGDPSASDVANITVGNTAQTANLGGTSPTITSGDMPTINLDGIEVVNMDANHQDLTVNGTSGNDSAEVSPTDTNAATVQVNDVSPVLNASGLGSLTVDLGGGTNQLTVNGTEAAETITVTPSSVAVGGLEAVTYANTNNLVVNGLAGDDIFSITATGGGTGFTPTIQLNGGDPLAPDSDTLALGGTTDADDTYTITPGADVQSGVAVVDINNVGASTVSFTGIEAITIDGGGGTGHDQLTVNGTGNDDAIDLVGTGAAAATVQVGGNPLITVSDFGSDGGVGTFRLNGLAGSDTFSVTPGSLDNALGIMISGDDPTAGSDTLVVDGTSSAEAIAFDPSTTVGSGTVTVDSSSLVTFDTIEQVVIDGQGGGDILTVNGPVAGLTYTVTGGANVDSGAVLVGGLVPMSFQNLGTSGGVTVFAPTDGSPNTLVMEGTKFSDTFTVTTTTAQLNSQLTVTYSGIGILTLEGGEPSTSSSDVADITAGASTVTANLGSTSPTITGGGLPTINLNGIEVVNLDASDEELIVDGTSGNDTAVVSPTASDAATIQVNAVSPIVNVTNPSALVVDLGDGSDQLTVNGTQDAETITVDSTSVIVDSLVPVNYANVENLDVEALAGADTIDVTPSATTTMYMDGGDPIGSQPGDNLIVHNGGNATIVWPGEENDDGGVDVAGSQTVSFDDIETMTIDGGGAATIMGTSEDDQITITADSTDPGTDGVQDFTVDRSDSVSILFLDTPAVTVDALAGSDEIVVIAPAVNGAVWDVDVTVDGGAPSASDKLVVQTPYDAQTATYTPSGAEDGTLDISSMSSTIHITEVEQLVFDGEAENDTLTVNWSGTNTYQSAGPATDAGSFSVGSLLPINFETLGDDAVLNVNSTADGDILVMKGTAFDDTFAVTTATVQLNDQLVINHNLDTADTLVLQGGDPSTSSDVADITGGGAAMTANLGSTAPTITGGGLPTIDLSGIEVVNLDTATGNLTVNGTSGNDSAVVSPTGAAAATVQMNAVSPVVYASNIGTTFLVDLLGGSDSLTVNGTESGNAITVTPVSVAVDSFKKVTYSHTENLVVNGLAGDDTFSVTATGTSPTIRLNGGDPLAPGSDTLVLGGTINVADTYAITPGTDSQSGVAVVNIAGDGASTVSFTGIEAITINGGGGTGSDQLTVNGTGGDNAIDFDGTGAAAAIAQVDGGPTITVSAFGSTGGAGTFTLNGLGGSDVITVTPDGLGSAEGITVNARYPRSKAAVYVNGTSGDDSIAVTTTSTTTGRVTVGSSAPVTVNSPNYLTVNGLDGNDTIAVTAVTPLSIPIALDGGAGDDTFSINTYTGSLTITGGIGSDTISFNNYGVGIRFDMDNATTLQSVASTGLKIRLTELIENLVGTAHPDIVYIDALAEARSVDLGDPTGPDFTLNPPGNAKNSPADYLFFDGQEMDVTVTRNGVPAINGTINAFGYETVTFTNVERLKVDNSSSVTNLGGFENAFTLSTDYPLNLQVLKGHKPRAVAIGDVNGDSNNDLILVTSSEPGLIYVMLGNGDGTFQPAQAVTTPSTLLPDGSRLRTLYDVALGDMNGDGDLDIVVTSKDRHNKANVAVLTNDGTGHFTPTQNILVPGLAATVLGLELGDLDNDGALDVAVSGYKRVVVLKNDGTGTLSIGDSMLTDGRYARSVALADVDHDGFNDILVSNLKGNKVDIFLNDGTGGFDPTPNQSVSLKQFGGKSPTALTVADFNNDGWVDFAVSNAVGKAFSVALNNADGSGTFTPLSQPTILPLQYQSIVAGDMNGDGKQDLVLTASDGNTVMVILGVGNGTFSTPYKFKVGNVKNKQPAGLAIADLNHDGGLDIVTADAGNNRISVMLQNPVV